MTDNKKAWAIVGALYDGKKAPKKPKGKAKK